MPCHSSEKLTYTKRKFHFLGEFKNCCTSDHPAFCFLFLSVLVTLASFLQITSASLRTFPPLVFQFLLHDFANRVQFFLGSEFEFPVSYRLDFES